MFLWIYAFYLNFVQLTIYFYINTSLHYNTILVEGVIYLGEALKSKNNMLTTLE